VAGLTGLTGLRVEIEIGPGIGLGVDGVSVESKALIDLSIL